MASGNEDQMIANFTEVTGIDTERGRFYLEASGWNLDVSTIILLRCSVSSVITILFKIKLT